MRGISRFHFAPAFTVIVLLTSAQVVRADEVADVAPPPSLFKHMLVSNGILFGPLMMLLALALTGLILRLAFGLRRGQALGHGLIPRLDEAAGAGPDRLAELTRGDRSCLAQALVAGMARLPQGRDEARHAVSTVITQLWAPQERALRWLGGLGLLSGLLGLLGTLFGLMLLCMAVARSGGAADRVMITGLSHALSVLLEGLFLACVAIFAYVVFKNRLQRLMLATGTAADELLTRASQA